MAVPEDLIWLDNAARNLGVHPATLRRWVQLGRLKTYKKFRDKRTYVDQEELDTLLKNPPVDER